MTDLADLLSVIREANTLTLATLDPDGTPRATPLFFAPDPNPSSSGRRVWPISLLFLSDPASIHSLNLAREPRAAVSLYPGETDWRSLRGAQMKGRVERLIDDESIVALGAYRRQVAVSPELEGPLARSAMYRFTPTWTRLIDNRQGFGHKREWTWP